MSLTTVGETSTGTTVGSIRIAGDLDYFDLGNIAGGMTVFLNARRLDYATLVPIVE